KSAQIREILINESAWEEMTCLFALSLDFTYIVTIESYRISDRSFSMSSLPTRKLKHKNS
ncbi:hypothetical protein VZN88_23955, partial [Klebsiella pneumoniae]